MAKHVAVGAKARVGVFTSQGCKHCRRAKVLLRDREILFVEVDLTTRPAEVRQALQRFTGRKTVPQVFINRACVGGADELCGLDESGELAARVRDAERQESGPFPEEVEELVVSSAAVEAVEGPGVAGGVDWERHWDLSEALRKALDWPHVKNALSGDFELKELAWALGRGDFMDDAGAEDAVRLRLVLPSAGSRYRLPPAGDPNVFNSNMVWPVESRPASVVAEHLRTRILGLYESFLSDNGRAVDYEGLARSVEFAAYVRDSSELRGVDLTPLTRDEKIAFFVNVYNALIVHATAVKGAPKNVVERSKFFGRIKYEIGGVAFSCDDMEHGVLRGNAPSPGSILSLLGLGCLAGGTFKKTDPRADLAVEPVDPRIHFALVCGAKSCPPIRLYSAANLEEGLQVSSTTFPPLSNFLSQTKRRLLPLDSPD